MVNQSGQRLLLVCRDPLMRKIRADLLKRCGYSVFPATDYKDALSRCKPDAYHAVLVSGEDDKQEALDFCEQVRSLNPHQIVIVIARPHVYIPGDSCPDDIVENIQPKELIESVRAALA